VGKPPAARLPRNLEEPDAACTRAGCNACRAATFMCARTVPRLLVSLPSAALWTRGASPLLSGTTSTVAVPCADNVSSSSTSIWLVFCLLPSFFGRATAALACAAEDALASPTNNAPLPLG